MPLRLFTVAAVILLAGLPSPRVLAQSEAPGLGLEEVVEKTLSGSYPVRNKADELRIREAELQIAEGAFDVSFGISATRSRLDDPLSLVERQTLEAATSRIGLTTYRLGGSKQFRSGLVVEPAIELSRHDSWTLRTPSTIRTRAVIGLSYPLLRGRSRIESAAVDAAEMNVTSGGLDLRDARARSIYRAAAAFWAYSGAHESLAILSESEAKAHRLLDETATLVLAEERPASDLDQLRAELADRVAARHRAEHALLETRQVLGLEMGLSAAEAASLPAPETPFPLPRGEILPAVDRVEAALADRPDLASARKRAAAAEIMLGARREAVRPQLDVRLEAGYAGLTEGNGRHLPPFSQNDVSGGSLSLSLVLDFPAENNFARGSLARQEAVLRQSYLAVSELEQSIASNIRLAGRQLRSTADELKEAEEAARLYAAAVESEKKKLQLNVSTQFDLILVEERLRNAMLARVAAQVRFGQALARLRFETGVLQASGGTAAALHLLLSTSSN